MFDDSCFENEEEFCNICGVGTHELCDVNIYLYSVGNKRICTNCCVSVLIELEEEVGTERFDELISFLKENYGKDYEENYNE